MNQFAMSLVSSIVAITLIEMILPSNKIKKYVVFVSSIVLVIVVINPITSILNKNIDIESVLKDNETFILNSEYKNKMQYAKEKDMQDTYNAFLKDDIISRMKENGYLVRNVSVKVDDKTYEVTEMELEIEHDDGSIQNVVINVSVSENGETENVEVSKIKDLLCETYGVEKSNIIINKIS